MNKTAKRLLFIALGVVVLLVTSGSLFNWYLTSRSYDPNYDYLSVLKSSPEYDYAEKPMSLFHTKPKTASLLQN